MCDLNSAVRGRFNSN